MEEESWEELLDLNDDHCHSTGDLLLPLPPSKRPNPSPSASRGTFLLRRCSSSSSSSSQNSQAQSLPSPFRPPPPPPPPHVEPPGSSPPRSLIPGPAGIVQAAMERRRQRSRNQNVDNDGDVNMGGDDGEDPISTQEYIRRAVEEEDNCDDGGYLDDDFSSDPWLSAIDFVRRQGLVDGDGAIGIPVKVVKSGVYVEKVPQVVAVLKSCTPNGFGDMIVTLKDPTGTIDASIHRKVLRGEFGKDISVGAVIILQKVSIFSPSHCAHYLNITLPNVVKLIPKDAGALLQQNYSTSTVKDAAPCSGEKSCMLQKLSSLSQGRTDGIMNSLRQNANMTQSVPSSELMEDIAASLSCRTSGIHRNQNAVAGKESLLMEQDVDTGKHEEVFEHKELKSLNQTGRGNSSEGVQYATAPEETVHVLTGQEPRNINITTLKPQMTAKASLPQWTDEQLDELFAFD